MANVKGSLAAKYYKKDHHYGPVFTYPPTTTTTIKSPQIFEDIITSIAETTTEIKEVLTDIFVNSNKTEEILYTSNNARANNPVIDESLSSNNTITMDNSTTIMNIFNITENGGTTIQNITEVANININNFSTATETIDYITSTLVDTVTPTINKDEHGMYMSYHKTSYIIMGVLITILIMVGIGLVTVYISYRKKNSAHISSHYHTQASREIPDYNVRDSKGMTIDQQSKC